MVSLDAVAAGRQLALPCAGGWRCGQSPRLAGGGSARDWKDQSAFLSVVELFDDWLEELLREGVLRQWLATFTPSLRV
ncbi:hypothetical protein CKO23_04510 [Thiocystis violacea]|nr:hypothetical protein [Thiocystis violacea]